MLAYNPLITQEDSLHCSPDSGTVPATASQEKVTKMDICLLCLEMSNELNAGVRVASGKWREENIELMLEKHFWPLKSMAPKAWLCSSCWTMLSEFHRFYKRIEDAHSYFNSMLKSEIDDIHDDYTHNDLLETATTTRDSNYELEVPINDFMDSAFPKYGRKSLVKSNENNEIFIINEVLTAKSDKHNDPLEGPLLGDETSEESPQSTSHISQPNSKYIPSNAGPDIGPVISEVYEIHSDMDLKTESDEIYEANDLNDQHKTLSLASAMANEKDDFVARNFKLCCGVCQAPMKTFQEVCKHAAEEHNQSGFVTCCNKKFYRRVILVEHIHWHLNPQYFKCHLCGKVLANRRCLEEHARVHTQQQRNYACRLCGKGFARATTLQRHELTHVGEEDRHYICDMCSKKFASNELLATHIRYAHSSESVVICYVCGKTLRSQAAFKRHMLQHEEAQRPTVTCDVCGLKLTDIGQLKLHKATTHPEGPAEYKCHLCPKVSPSLRALKSHVHYKHELGYNFKCTICGKAFKRPIALREHMATHTGTALYTCSYCPKTFKSNANMHSHRKKVHPEKWEEACREKYSGNLPTISNSTITIE